MARIRVNASELAALVGMHAYKSAEEAEVDLWKRTHPASFRAASQRCGTRIRTAAETLNAAPVAVARSVRAAVHACSEAEASTAAAKALLLPLIQANKSTVASIVAAASASASASAAAASAAAAAAASTASGTSGSDPVAQHNAQVQSIQTEQELRVQVKALVADGRLVERVVSELQSLGAACGAAGAPVAAAQVAAVLARPKVGDCKETAAAVASCVNTQRGVRHEDDGIQLYERATGLTVNGKNDRVYARALDRNGRNDRNNRNDKARPPGKDGEDAAAEDEGTDEDAEADNDNNDDSNDNDDENCRVVLCGRVDGLVNSQSNSNGQCNKVVEVKCRRARFFTTIPLYELVQAHAYMFLTRRKSCDVVQKFGQKIQINTLKMDGKFWARVRTLTVKAARKVHALPKQASQVQDALLLCAAAKHQ